MGQRHGLTTVGFTGFGGGKLKSLAQHNLHVAIDDMGIVESLHQVVFHWVIDDIYRRISGPVAAAARASLIRRCPSPCSSASRSAAPSSSSAWDAATAASWRSSAGRSSPPGAPRASSRRSRDGVGPLLASLGDGQRADRRRGHRLRRPGRRRPGGRDHVAPGRRLGRLPPGRLGPRSGSGVPLVALQNDADTAGLGEARFGAGAGSRRCST